MCKPLGFIPITTKNKQQMKTKTNPKCQKALDLARHDGAYMQYQPSGD
jgi:hypothetical protein